MRYSSLVWGNSFAPRSRSGACECFLGDGRATGGAWVPPGRPLGLWRPACVMALPAPLRGGASVAAASKSVPTCVTGCGDGANGDRRRPPGSTAGHAQSRRDLPRGPPVALEGKATVLLGLAQLWHGEAGGSLLRKGQGHLAGRRQNRSGWRLPLPSFLCFFPACLCPRLVCGACRPPSARVCHTGPPRRAKLSALRYRNPAQPRGGEEKTKLRKSLLRRFK